MPTSDCMIFNVTVENTLRIEGWVFRHYIKTLMIDDIDVKKGWLMETILAFSNEIEYNFMYLLLEKLESYCDVEA